MAGKLPALASVPEVAAAFPLLVWGPAADTLFLSQLLEREVRGEEGRLLDHGLREVTGLVQPTVVPDPGAEVAGCLLRQLHGEDYRRLDAYHGVAEGLYHRVRARAWGQGAAPETVWVYLPTERLLLGGRLR